MTENIQHIRLINGEELIGDVVDYYDNRILVSQPLLVNERVSATGKSAIVLTKYIPFSSSSVCELQNKHVITITDIHEEMVKYYHHSLRFAYVHEENMIKDIQSVNTMMEASLMDMCATGFDTANSSSSFH